MKTNMTASTATRIQDNYAFAAMMDRMKQALEKAGLGSGPLQWSDLVGFDQFHVRGLEATKEMADALKLKPGQSVLDVGSGLGGPARYLAAVHGVHVTGIDLTPDYVAVSDYLSERAGLAGKLTFQQGDATDLPFKDEQFDVAWTQHVAMNIPDKSKLYKSVWRVLKPGGRFAIYDAIQGNDQPVIYPTPWARDETISFLATESEIEQALTGAGFSTLSFVDGTDTAAQWFRELQQQRAQQQQSQQAPSPLNPVLILGPELLVAIGNFARNVLEGRVRIVRIIAEKQ
jgi:ubiquinone/menaquinone biosynthesis C-methylase UbiE